MEEISLRNAYYFYQTIQILEEMKIGLTQEQNTNLNKFKIQFLDEIKFVCSYKFEHLENKEEINPIICSILSEDMKKFCDLKNLEILFFVNSVLYHPFNDTEDFESQVERIFNKIKDDLVQFKKLKTFEYCEFSFREKADSFHKKNVIFSR